MSEQESIVNLMRNVDIFSRLREYELDSLARYSRYIRVEKGSPVFCEGSRAEALYILDQGEVRIKRQEEGTEIDIAHILQGESFGALDLMEMTERSASAYAEKDSILLEFPIEGTSFHEIMQKHPDIYARIIFKFLGLITERMRHIGQMLNEKTQWIHELRKQLTTDKLTGLYNRNYLEEEGNSIFNRFDGSPGIIFIKPDNFKTVNDSYGHESGDRVLTLLAIFIQSVLLENDLAVRYRGDEFVIVTGLENENSVINTATDIYETLSTLDISAILSDDSFQLSFSIGTACCSNELDTIGDLIFRAYGKMLAIRNEGGGGVA